MGNLETADLEYYLLRGGVPPSVASLAGDLSAMEKAIVARILQSTSPGLTRNKAGSLGEQLQYLIDIIDNSVAPGDASLAAGSISAMLKYIVANGGATPASVRNKYLPNGFDVFGFYGAVANLDSSTNTDTTVPAIQHNIRAGGFRAVTNGSGTVSFQDNNAGVTGRPLGIKLLVTNAAGDRAKLVGSLLSGGNRIVGWPVTNMPNSYTKVEFEFVCSFDSIAAGDLFIGWADQVGASVTPWTAVASDAIGVGFQGGDANWSAVGIANGVPTVSKTSTGVALATNTIYKGLVSFDGTTLSVTINGTTVTKSTNLPTQANMNPNAAPMFEWNGKASATARVWFEWGIERMA